MNSWTFARADRRRRLHQRQSRHRLAARRWREWLQYMTSDRPTALTAERARNGHPEAVEDRLFRGRQRNLGLRRQHDARSTMPISSSSMRTFSKRPRGARPVDRRQRRQRQRHVMDRDADLARCIATSARSRFHYYTIPGDKWESKGPATGFGEDQWISTLAHTLRMDDFITQNSRDHGQVRSREEDRLRRRRMGHLVRSGSRARAGLPLSAEHAARCAGRGAQLQHLPPPCRSRAHGQHRADGQRAAGDDPDRRPEDGADADLSRLPDVPAVPGRDLSSRRRSAHRDYKLGAVSVPSVSISAARTGDGSDRRGAGQSRSRPCDAGDGGDRWRERCHR